MVELLLSIVNQFLVPAFIVLLTGTITYVSLFIKKKYNEFITNETVRDIVETSVMYVEQKFKDLKGSEKYIEALDRINSLLEQKGITVTKEQVDNLLETAVYTLTDTVKTEE